ncbi:hypothetical protein [Streptomyces sp. NPDC088812]|uniref:hypothetical protein n=1 Tax=Streptomyces sp. NPDC088812 TaxID=3365905 RepID=UPI00382AD43C
MTQPALGVRSLDLTDPATFIENDIHEFWREVRAERPVHWQDPTDRNAGFWVVSRYSDIQSLYHNPALNTPRPIRSNLLAGHESLPVHFERL